MSSDSEQENDHENEQEQEPRTTKPNVTSLMVGNQIFKKITERTEEHNVDEGTNETILIFIDEAKEQDVGESFEKQKSRNGKHKSSPATIKDSTIKELVKNSLADKIFNSDNAKGKLKSIDIIYFEIFIFRTYNFYRW